MEMIYKTTKALGDYPNAFVVSVQLNRIEWNGIIILQLPSHKPPSNLVADYLESALGK